MRWTRLSRVVLVAIALVAAGALPVQAADKIGIVLMHGKTGRATPQSPTGVLRESLEGAGFLVAAPDMPWSRDRMLAKDYEASMAEIDDAVRSLKADGATRIVVGGHSMGANAALGYGARRDGIAGILAIAPGHTIDTPEFQKAVGHDYWRAKAMVSAGKGRERAEFNDVNQGRRSTIYAEAAAYLSWFDPEGPARMPANAASLRPGTALLWIVGKRDPMARRGREYAFAKAPKNPKSAYILINSNHRDTPMDGTAEIIAWLRKL